MPQAPPSPVGDAAQALPVHSAPRTAVEAQAWVPIRSLAHRHLPDILAHLLALSAQDRYLRFGYAATDEQITRYVEGLNFTRDEVFGIFNRRLRMIALAHVAFPPQDAPPPRAAEFGGSVLGTARGRGYGGRLFEHAMLHARNRGIGQLFIHALSENTTMLRIARRAGAKVERAGSESDAYLQLPQDTLASQVEQWVGNGAAEIDFRMKQQAQLVGSLIDVIGEVKTGIGKSGGGAARD